jgi:hypothetical protein
MDAARDDVNGGRAGRRRIIIIGTMKSGSTTLFDRLGQQPGVSVGQQKEPNYFSSEHHRGRTWYEAVWGTVAEGVTPIDASVSYCLPDHAREAARRIAAEEPDPRLVVLLRHPVDRMRSHYLHEVQRRREQRAFLDAATPGSRYALASDYAECLQPYLDGPLAARLLAVRTEDLDDPRAWRRLLGHVGLSSGPLPSIVRNVGAAKEPFSRLGAALWSKGWLQQGANLPAPVRRRLRRIAFSSRATDDLIASAEESLPEDLREQLLASAHRAGRALGIDTTSWS